jgi:hypothetical protein
MIIIDGKRCPYSKSGKSLAFAFVRAVNYAPVFQDFIVRMPSKERWIGALFGGLTFLAKLRCPNKRKEKKSQC